jgi:hypothetical protein
VDFRVLPRFGLRHGNHVLSTLELRRHPRDESHRGWLLSDFISWALVDVVRLLATRQKVHSKDVAVLCTGWFPLVLLRAISTAST